MVRETKIKPFCLESLCTYCSVISDINLPRRYNQGNSIPPGPCDTFYLSYETLFKTSTGSKGRGNSRSSALQVDWMEPGLYGLLGKKGGKEEGLWMDETEHILQHMCPGMRSRSRHQIFHYWLKWLRTFQAPLFPYTESLEGARLAHVGRICAGMVDGGEGNSLLAQVLRNQVSLPRVSRWPERQPVWQALDLRWGTPTAPHRINDLEKRQSRWGEMVVHLSVSTIAPVSQYTFISYVMHHPCLYTRFKFRKKKIKYEMNPQVCWKRGDNKKIVVF